MAEQSGSEEKTEEATPKRLRDSRKKGQVAKSRDLDTLVVLVGGFIILVFMYEYIGSNFKELILSNILLATGKGLTDEKLFLHGRLAFMTFMKIIAPFGLGIVCIAIAVNFFQVGSIFSADPVKPQTKRLNIIENVKQKFKMTTLVELLKNIAKISLIFLLAYLVVTDMLSQIVLTVTATPEKSAQLAGHIIVLFLIKVFIVFIVISIIDVFVQRWQYKKQLKMTKDEVKREYKQDEGDPLIKSIRKQLHQELAMGDVGRGVAASDAVITNPIHLAVAIKYDEKEMVAPQVMAKGQRAFAETIKEFARQADVPIIENPPLAWTLIEVEVGEEIPEEIYQAVAEILVTVYKMKDENEKGLIEG
ncbi:MAG: EscU/YscU/HrcU family type III secretion system export apparatus switch protein [Pseudomonadota bacterium]